MPVQRKYKSWNLLCYVGVSTGKLYAVGGYDGGSRQCLSTVEEYDPVSDQWCYVADMSTRRSGAGTEALLTINTLFVTLCENYKMLLWRISQVLAQDLNLVHIVICCCYY